MQETASGSIQEINLTEDYGTKMRVASITAAEFIGNLSLEIKESKDFCPFIMVTMNEIIQKSANTILLYSLNLKESGFNTNKENLIRFLKEVVELHIKGIESTTFESVKKIYKDNIEPNTCKK